MSDIGDIDDGETGESAEPSAPIPDTQNATPSHLTCLSCGAPIAGVFCGIAGRKMMIFGAAFSCWRAILLKTRSAFDSRMWRTLGMLAMTPGAVPLAYSHGKRSRFTPPVRLFLVVSFLFFLTLSVTQTLFAAIEVRPRDETTTYQLSFSEPEAGETTAPEATEFNCDLTASLRFFVRASRIDNDLERWARCMENVDAATDAELERSRSKAAERGVDEDDLKEIDKISSILDTAFSGVGAAIENPTAFNAAFNAWLPRVMFLMTPITALLMGVFIRGRDALFFDHMVMALYGHAVAFAVVGAAILLTQIGAPMAAPVAALALFVYFVMSTKRAYQRGWVKTVYSSTMVSFFYIVILFVAVILITLQIILRQ